MRILPLLAAALVAIGGPSLLAQDPLPADLEQKVLAVVQDPSRAKLISETMRTYDARRQHSFVAVRAAREKMAEVFLAQGSAADDRRISMQNFRDDRRKAMFQTIDALFAVRGIVSRKEWAAIWPKDAFAFPSPMTPVAVKVHDALPSVVADPGRRKLALDVTAPLVKAAAANESARKKEAGRLERLLKEGAIPRDEVVTSVADMEKAQEKMDETFVAGSGQLQKILTPDEWTALTRAVTAKAP